MLLSEINQLKKVYLDKRKLKNLKLAMSITEILERNKIGL